MIFRRDCFIRPNMSAWLDAIRGPAAVAVVLGHLGALMFPQRHPPATEALVLANTAFLKLSAFSHEAVIVFFVLSGYLVGGVGALKLILRREGPSDYLFARLSRMYTVLVPALMLTWLLTMWAETLPDSRIFFDSRPRFFPSEYEVAGSLSGFSALCNLAFLQTIACQPFGANLVLWSLSNEFLYYMAFLTMVLAIGRKPYLLGTILLLLVMLAAEFQGAGFGIAYLFYFGIWLLGAAAFAVAKTPRRGVCAAAILLASLFGVVLLRRSPDGIPFAQDLLLALAASSFLVVVETWDLALRFMPRRAMALLASIGFSLYAIHLPVLIAALILLGGVPYQPTWPAFALCAVLLAAMLAAAWLFHSLTERHTLAVRNWMKRAWRSVSGPAAPVLRTQIPPA